jgi:hypothetical protein
VVVPNVRVREHGGEPSQHVLSTLHANRERRAVERNNSELDTEEQTEIRVEPLSGKA